MPLFWLNCMTPLAAAERYGFLATPRVACYHRSDADRTLIGARSLRPFVAPVPLTRRRSELHTPAVERREDPRPGNATPDVVW